MTKKEIEQLMPIIDEDGDGKINLLEFDGTIREYHRRLIMRTPLGGEESGDDSSKSAVSLLFSPSRVSTKCPCCEIGLAEPPIERNPRYGDHDYSYL